MAMERVQRSLSPESDEDVHLVMGYGLIRFYVSFERLLILFSRLDSTSGSSHASGISSNAGY